VSLDTKMMAAPVTLSPDGQSLEPGTPAAPFPVRIAGGPVTGPGILNQQYAVSVGLTVELIGFLFARHRYAREYPGKTFA
jgi:hypothetical protein